MLKGAHSAEVSRGVDVHTVLQPVGVVAGITPFNFPVMVPLWMLANALACGNAFVLKPSEKDPSASLLLAELVQRAGFPDGVFNVVQGDAEAVDALLTHPEVDAVSFVGSTAVGTTRVRDRYPSRQAGAGPGRSEEPHGRPPRRRCRRRRRRRGVRCVRIGGGALHGHLGRRRGRAGCGHARRRHRRPHPDVVIGPGGDEPSMMGPLITPEHRDRVRSYVERAADEGAEVVVDGSDVTIGDGFFVGCSLLDAVMPGMRVYDDEIFGPVLSVVRVGTFDEAVTLVNANPYGNGVALFTRDGGAARRFERDVEVGMVGINVPIPVPVASYSFGGWKASLFGDTRCTVPMGSGSTPGRRS